ncbi:MULTISPECIES: hypothetical protein [Bacillaceae]|uniref:hypothetical protein n=1 Tax=Bacillaceae TaxID=186817 RepID=UPI001A8F0CFF|nr:hypothetical protein [Bacillus sp. NTK034]MBN8203399.1 hypothetical protein [Bacillus sp. NTK034]
MKGHNEEHQKSIMILSVLRILSSSKYVSGWGIVTESNTHIQRVSFIKAKKDVPANSWQYPSPQE